MSKNIYITIDVDWAIDPVMEYCLDLLDALNIRATINITHKTKLIERMRKKHELGIHPNFNMLLEGQSAKMDNYREVIKNVKALVPDAKTVRSHACVCGSQLHYAFAENGLKYELNTMIIPSKGQRIFPWKLANVWQIPYIFEDDVFFSSEEVEKEYWFDSDWNMVRVLNFHPIHIFLNTETLDRYNRAKPYLKDFNRLVEFRNAQNYGTENLLKNMVNMGKSKEYEFRIISELEDVLR